MWLLVKNASERATDGVLALKLAGKGEDRAVHKPTDNSHNKKAPKWGAMADKGLKQLARAVQRIFQAYISKHVSEKAKSSVSSST